MQREQMIQKKERRNLLKQKRKLKFKLRKTLQQLLELDDKCDEHVPPIPDKDTKTEELKLRLSLANLILEEEGQTLYETTEAEVTESQQTAEDEDEQEKS
ncbi:hypothetical protein WUBG_17365 [Wuchereria bancrofti]|uniref:Uncharacterized protein n=1 Tax=Wuchereria bancrofti TaxID=6293 RepID=J9DQA4_WUCBA|nr:hypothetical protein WUBG_17365 [Wuchereria bancrofti]